MLDNSGWTREKTDLKVIKQKLTAVCERNWVGAVAFHWTFIRMCSISVIIKRKQSSEGKQQEWKVKIKSHPTTTGKRLDVIRAHAREKAQLMN